MGITRQQPGAAKAAIATGVVIGGAAREKEDRARAERQQAQAAQAKARQTAMDWELQKMQMRSEQDFQQELTDRQWDNEQFNRAKKWDIEKMELRSRMDFEIEEKERQRKLDVIRVERTTWEKEVKEGRASEKELIYELDKLDNREMAIKMEFDARERAVKMDETYRPGDQQAEQRAANRETRAQEAARRAVAGAPTPEEIERERYETFLGDWAKSLSLPELKTEAQSEGFALQQQDTTQTPNNIPYPTPNSQEAYDAIPSGSTYIDSAGNERTKS
jgi:hypothetical protein